MKRILSTMTRLALLALFLAPCAAAHADTVTFAAFSDGAPGKWIYSSGTVTAVGDPAFFIAFPAPTPILNYIGFVTYDVNAHAVGPATLSGGTISQELDGQITFKNGSTTVLDVLFDGALISGVPNSKSTGLAADTQITGNVISYASDPSIQVAPFIAPFSFSIALTQTPGLAISGNNLADFTATASGTFTTDPPAPTPLPPPAPIALALFGCLFAARQLRRKAIA